MSVTPNEALQLTSNSGFQFGIGSLLASTAGARSASEALLAAAERLIRSGLGAEFVDAVDHAAARIAEAPRLGAPVPGIADETIRRRAVHRFPYHLIYVELPDRLQVLAIAHDRRRPGYWVGGLPA